MRLETVRFVVDDEAHADYHRAVWLLADALAVIGARDRVVPTLLALFEEVLPNRDHRLPLSSVPVKVWIAHEAERTFCVSSSMPLRRSRAVLSLNFVIRR